MFFDFKIKIKKKIDVNENKNILFRKSYGKNKVAKIINIENKIQINQLSFYR